MNIEYTIKMTPSEKEKYRQIAVNTKALLTTYADSIEDSKVRAEVWDKIRNYNKLMEVFTS